MPGRPGARRCGRSGPGFPHWPDSWDRYAAATARLAGAAAAGPCLAGRRRPADAGSACRAGSGSAHPERRYRSPADGQTASAPRACPAATSPAGPAAPSDPASGPSGSGGSACPPHPGSSSPHRWHAPRPWRSDPESARSGSHPDSCCLQRGDPVPTGCQASRRHRAGPAGPPVPPWPGCGWPCHEPASGRCPSATAAATGHPARPCRAGYQSAAGRPRGFPPDPAPPWPSGRATSGALRRTSPRPASPHARPGQRAAWPATIAPGPAGGPCRAGSDPTGHSRPPGRWPSAVSRPVQPALRSVSASAGPACRPASPAHRPPASSGQPATGCASVRRAATDPPGTADHPPSPVRPGRSGAAPARAGPDPVRSASGHSSGGAAWSPEWPSTEPASFPAAPRCGLRPWQRWSRAGQPAVSGGPDPCRRHCPVSRWPGLLPRPRRQPAARSPAGQWPGR